MLTLYYVALCTPSADKFSVIFEAHDPEEAMRIAQAAAIEAGEIDEEDLEPDSDVYFEAPELITPPSNIPGVLTRLV